MMGERLILSAVVWVFCAAPDFAQQPAAQRAPKPGSNSRLEQMRLTTKSEHVRELFGQAIVLSGNYRLDECLKSLRTAVAEDATFAAGWSLLAYLATDAHETAVAVAHAQSLVAKTSPGEMLFVRWVAAQNHKYTI